MTNDPKELLKIWSKHADAVESYIINRDYRNFRLGYRKAEQCSRKITFIMKHAGTDGFIEYKQEVKRLVERWNGIALLLKPWMADIEQKLEKVRVRKKQGKRINKAYGYVRSAGATVRIKAR